MSVNLHVKENISGKMTKMSEDQSRLNVRQTKEQMSREPRPKMAIQEEILFDNPLLSMT